MKVNKLFFLSGCLIALCFFLPFFFLGTNAYLVIHDNLDSEFVWLDLLKRYNLLFSFHSDTVIPGVMNGIPRSLIHSEFSFVRLFFYILPSFWAYVVNSVIVRIIGFVGMYLLVKDYLIRKDNMGMSIVIAVLFAIIPLYHLYGLSVMGQPILIWAFLNVSHNYKTFINWIIIILFPFYSHFALIAPFILSGLFGYSIYKLIAHDKINYRYYYLGMVLLFCCFILANLITLKSFLFPNDFVSHRTLWLVKANSLSIKTSLQQFFETFIKGQYHSASFISIPIYSLTLIAIFVKGNIKKSFLIAPIIIIAIISFFNAFYPLICYWLQDSFRLINIFQFNRFTFLIPILWFISLSIAIKHIENKVNHIIIYFIIILQAFFILKQNEELRLNYSKILFNSPDVPNFKTFYSVALFSEISDFINKPKNEYNVVSLGMFPSIAQYNGFYTLDSYQNNYSLKYKLEFRKIIENELSKNYEMKKYFDEWGSRCYLFSSELWGNCHFNCLKNSNVQVNHLNINTPALKKMKGEYIFSAVPITNFNDLKLNFIRKFSNKDSMWDVYLYRLE